MSSLRPRSLVVVGAAAGVARWFCDNVLCSLDWDHVRLLDTSAAVSAVPGFGGDIIRTVIAPDTAAGRAPDLAMSVDDVVVVLGVPIETIHLSAQWLRLVVNSTTPIVDLSHDRLRADAVLGAAGFVNVVGVHALFGTTALSADGQTFAVCPSTSDLDAHRWITETIESVGGTVNELTAVKHDEIMRYVQTASHQALLTFADVIGRCGLDIEDDLWANRTPVFELLLALASRALSPGQEATTASIQQSDSDRRIAAAFVDATERLGDGRDADLAAHLADVRAPFPGGLFTKVQQVGALATTAVQSTRAQISRQRRTNELVGVRSLMGNDRLHVGRIVRLTPTSFVLDDLLVGQPGRAAVLHDATAKANARKLGIGGKTRTVEFSLGRVRILTAEELDGELTAWLPVVARGCKVLVPESISGTSAVHVVRGVAGVVGCDLVSEEVRLGQREIVVRFTARLDRDLEEIERAIQGRVDDVFVWPDGTVLPITAHSIGFLGPAGTFSDTASRQLARLANAERAQRTEFASFSELIDAVSSGVVDAGVVPIANSSTGLVDLAAGALLEAPDSIVAGGVVDVLVRFDAYVAPGSVIRPGDTVYTHPQVIRQCSQFISAQSFSVVECNSTVDACRRVREQGHGIAIANVGLEVEVGLELGRASVGNLAGAVTRFLVIARRGSFGDPLRSDATLRSVWVVDRADRVETCDAARVDEVIVGPTSRTLVVSTLAARLPAGSGTRFMGTIPWSPRTPLVLVG